MSLPNLEAVSCVQPGGTDLEAGHWRQGSNTQQLAPGHPVKADTREATTLPSPSGSLIGKTGVEWCMSDTRHRSHADSRGSSH